jgi:sulfur relay (sulfurtransferase) DsrC/TusE family protein
MEKVLMLILDVITRWSSTYHMMDRALDFKEELQKFMDRYDFSVSISEDNWKVIEIVRDWLKAFHEATVQMSTTNKPMLSEVLLVYAGLQQHLQNLIRGFGKSSIPIDPSLRACLVQAHEKLGKYRLRALENHLYYWAIRK